MEYGSFLLALLPIVLLMLLLGVFKVPAHFAAVGTLIVTAIIAFLHWEMPGQILAGAIAEGSAMGLWPIMIVIVAAIFSYNLAKESGSMGKITTILESVTTDKRIQVLILAWGFGGFLEAVAGYGTAVAIPAGILAALGVKPTFAAVLSLIANTAPTAFGAIGIPVSTLAELTDLDPNMLSSTVALQLTPFITLIPFVLVMMVGGGFKALKGVWGITLASGLSFAVPQYLAAKYLGAQLPALIGAIGSLTVTILIAVKMNKGERKTFSAKYMWEAWRPYILILVLILGASTLVPPVHEALAGVKTSVHFVEGAKPFVFKWIATPGALIFIATILAGLLAKMNLKKIFEVFWTTIKQLGKSFPTVLSIIALAKVMGYSGMTKNIADGLAYLTGPVFPFISPLIGTLGTFVTGSDTSSNVLFGQLQTEIARELSVNQYWLAAANTTGATAGKMISPQSIAVATSATGLMGKEGEIFSQTLKYCLGYVLILGIMVGIGATLGLV